MGHENWLGHIENVGMVVVLLFEEYMLVVYIPCVYTMLVAIVSHYWNVFGTMHVNHVHGIWNNLQR